MASGPEGTEPLSYQTSVLKVSIHCEGCKKKVRKVLQRLDGVYDIDINSNQNKVTVTGKVDAESLIRRLAKYGKHAELWPEKKADAANSSGEATIDTKAKVASATAVPKTERHLPNTEKQQQTEEDQNKPTPPPPTTEAKATDSTAAAASAAMPGAFSASKPSTDAPKPNEITENSDKKDSDKAAPAAVENGSSEEADDLKKKKGKNAQSETTSIDERAVAADTNNLGNASAAAISPPKPKPFQAYPQPIYSVSYSAVQPSTSHAYYTSSPAAMPSSYTYSGYPPENYSLDPYYGSMEAPAASGGSYDMFNDENPNACNLM